MKLVHKMARQQKLNTVEECETLFNQIAHRFGVVNYEIALKEKEAKWLITELEKVSTRAAHLKKDASPSTDISSVGSDYIPDPMTPGEVAEAISANDEEGVPHV